MFWYFLIAGSLLIVYAFCMLLYLRGWNSTKEFLPDKSVQAARVTIIIPARNEEISIGDCLTDILDQTYPSDLYEVIVVDDFSEDRTCSIVKSYNLSNVKLLHLKDFYPEKNNGFSYKKKAIEIAIKQAHGDLIITTDADCRMGKNWISILVNYYQNKRCKMIIGPVLFVDGNNLFEKFQALDYLGMVSIAAGTLYFNFPTLCSGANMLYEKSAFDQVEGYAGNETISSGDDMLLMHKIWKQWPGAVCFLKNSNATVCTSPEKNLKDFISQRLRWTSKSSKYSDWKIKLNLLLVYLFNLTVLISFFLSLFNICYLYLFIVQIAVKLILDFSLLQVVSKFFKHKSVSAIFLLSEPLHIIYITIVGFLGISIRPNWKGRKVQ